MTPLNLDDIKNNKASEVPEIDSELSKDISAAANASKNPVPILNEGDQRTEEDSIMEDLDREIAEEDAVTTTIDVTPEEEGPIDPEEIEKEAIKKEQQEADARAKEYVEDMLSDENIELDDDAIYKKKEQERKSKKEQEESRERYLELKESYQAQIINSGLDELKEYRFAKAPVSVSKIFQNNLTQEKVGAWGLYTSGLGVAMTEIGGPEMEILTQQTSDNDLIDQVATFEIIHKHIVDANKGTIEEYFKRMTYLDLRDLFFTAYKASYKSSNYASFNCTNERCKKMFMQPIALKDMVVYPNEKVEERMKKIINQDPTSGSMIKKKIIHVSPDYAATIDIPSIYKIIFEQRMLSSDFRRKNEDLNNTLMYVDEIFYKDKDSKTLNPIDTKPDPNNIALSVKRRIAIYSKILMRITSDDYAHLKQQINDYITKYTDEDNRIVYQLPEVKCPHCGTTIPAQRMDPLTMLFIRHQLGRLLSIRKS